MQSLGLNRGLAPHHHKSAPTASRPSCTSRTQRLNRPGAENAARTVTSSAAGQWHTFGPSASHLDGDAEFYNTSNRLAQQHPGFAPTSSIQGEQPVGVDLSGSEEDIKQEVMQELRRTRPEFGLSARQINSLGLSGPRLNMPDSVSAVCLLCLWFNHGTSA
jgi:hypothetical protein